MDNASHASVSATENAFAAAENSKVAKDAAVAAKQVAINSSTDTNAKKQAEQQVMVLVATAASEAENAKKYAQDAEAQRKNAGLALADLEVMVAATTKLHS